MLICQKYIFLNHFAYLDDIQPKVYDLSNESRLGYKYQKINFANVHVSVPLNAL